MAELGTNDHWTTDASSQYARMIPGHPVLPSLRFSARRETHPSKPGARPGIEKPSKLIQPQTVTGLFLPHPIADPFTLYQQVVADLLIIGVVCSAQRLLLPEWSLPAFDLPIFAVLVTLFGFTEGMYRDTRDPFPSGIVLGLARCIVFSVLLSFLASTGNARLRAVPATFISSLSALLLYRYARRVARAQRKQDCDRRVLIVGAGPVAHSIARALRSDPHQRTVVRGFVADGASRLPGVLGEIADMDWLARAEFIDEVILALPGEPGLTREAAEVAFRNHLDIRAVPDLPPGPWPDARIDYIGEVPIVTLHREELPGAALLAKRCFDVVSAALCLTLAAPLMAVIAVLIRLDTPGGAIYEAERIGAKGRRFRCYKFRSMFNDADLRKAALREQNERQGPIFKIIDDPRVTRAGRFIRRYSLDELPQLWNVLRGDMSMVGPRPHPVDDVNRYQLHHYRRLDVKPGITGLWQVTARHSPSFDLNMHLDLTYIENWSLRLDAQILLNTVRVLFVAEGA